MIELPFSIVLKDCYNIIHQLYDIDLSTHFIEYHLNQEANYFDLPNQVFLTNGDFCTTYEIPMVWHEVFHYLHSLLENLEDVPPHLVEYYPMIGESLAIDFYDLKCQEWRNRVIKKDIALSLIDLELRAMDEVTQELFYNLIEHVQNVVQLNISVDELEPIMSTRYSGAYWGYLLCRQ